MKFSFNKLPPLLSFAIKHNQNVLFVGDHGIGKSTIIMQAFKDAGLNFRYYSASTMDPWVDFLGVPKEVKNESGEPVLRLVRPEGIDTEVEALIFDELNRSHPKIRNAVMELIQFKSINGRRFPNLRVVWAAINPSDSEASYDVEELDPAQQDRFHHIIELPYQPDVSFFKKKFNNLGESACEWWGAQTKDVKKAISPRRMDYALEIVSLGGNADSVLFGVQESVIKDFTNHIESSLFTSSLFKLLDVQDIEERRTEVNRLCSSIKGRKMAVGVFNNSHELLPLVGLLSEEIGYSMVGEFSKPTLEKLSQILQESQDIDNPEEEESIPCSLSSEVLNQAINNVGNSSPEAIAEFLRKNKMTKDFVSIHFNKIDEIVNTHVMNFNNVLSPNARRNLIFSPEHGPFALQAKSLSEFITPVITITREPIHGQDSSNPKNTLIERAYQLSFYMVVRMFAMNPLHEEGILADTEARRINNCYTYKVLETFLSYKIRKSDLGTIVANIFSLGNKLSLLSTNMKLNDWSGRTAYYWSNKLVNSLTAIAQTTT